jgi:SAM-dependent methyltransferase
MPDDLEFTGERYVPGIAGEIAYEHWHRYAFVRRLASGRRVLDVACGEGYGSALLAQAAAQVTGVDIDQSAIAHAQASYGTRSNLRYLHGSATKLPLADASVDLVVSFETIEHLPRDEQPRMLAELARVCAPGGIAVLSAPNPVEYSQARGYSNPFHLHEPSREELAQLIAAVFPAQRWYRQRRYFGSALWRERSGSDAFEVLTCDDTGVRDASPPPAMYYLVIATRNEADLPPPAPGVSLFSDRGETELRRLDDQAAEVMRLDGLLKSRDASLDGQTAHIRHLEELVAYRDRIVQERDAELVHARSAFAAAVDQQETTAHERDVARADTASARQALDAMTAECARLERAIAAQERIIAHRQTLRWWLALPWLRIKLAWQHLCGR